jgi:hypothetical protein
MLSINREPPYGDKLRKYVVVLDGKPVGKIADSETRDFAIKPGAHTLYLRIDLARSQKAQFHTNNDQRVVFRCSSSLKGLRILLAIFYVTVLRTKYIKLERIA